MSAQAEFATAIQAALGHAPVADRIVPGKYVRFSTNGKRSDDSGYAMLFGDERAGVFGCWRSGHEGIWHAARTPLTMVEQVRRSQEIDEARQLRAAEDARKRKKSIHDAGQIWASAALALNHPYARKKEMSVQGMRVQQGQLGHCAGAFYKTDEQGATKRLTGLLLLIPMYTADRQLAGIQAINEAGSKSFLRGCRTRGLFFPVGSKALKDVAADAYVGQLAIAEGVATAWTVHQMSSSPTFAAFSAGNLLPVAEAIRGRFPKSTITIAGDLDASGVGQAKAEEAARAIKGLVSFPPLTAAEVGAGASDWNDFIALHPAGEREELQA